MALSLALSLTSYLFYKFSGLYFFLEESGEPYPVNQLVSGGSDENFVFAYGIVIFLLLAMLNLWRFRKPITKSDISTHFLALLLQGALLLFIEVGSFAYSLRASNGWILMIWLIVFSSLWVMLSAMILCRKK